MVYHWWSLWGVILVLAACTYATYTDLKTREIPNWLTYGLIVIGIVGNVIVSYLISDKFIVNRNWIIMLAFFVMLYILFRVEALGGGDVKLLCGVCCCLPNILFLLLLCFYIFATGLIFSIYAKVAKKKIKEVAYAPIILLGVMFALCVQLILII